MKLVFILSCLLHLANVLHVAKAPTCHLPLPNCRATERECRAVVRGESQAVPFLAQPYHPVLCSRPSTGPSGVKSWSGPCKWDPFPYSPEETAQSVLKVGE